MLGQAPDPSLVPTLLKGRSPAAVLGSIGPVIVDPIDRHSGGRFAHVFKESLEAVEPTVADENSAAAVIFEVLVFWVETTPLHPCPALVSWCVRAPMCSVASIQHLTLKAAATDCFTADHPNHRDWFVCPAVAMTEPDRFLEFVSMQEVERDQATEALACDILASGHSGLRESRLCQEVARRLRAGPLPISTPISKIFQ
jgi:hypothetical protein